MPRRLTSAEKRQFFDLTRVAYESQDISVLQNWANRLGDIVPKYVKGWIADVGTNIRNLISESDIESARPLEIIPGQDWVNSLVELGEKGSGILRIVKTYVAIGDTEYDLERQIYEILQEWARSDNVDVNGTTLYSIIHLIYDRKKR